MRSCAPNICEISGLVLSCLAGADSGVANLVSISNNHETSIRLKIIATPVHFLVLVVSQSNATSLG